MSLNKLATGLLLTAVLATAGHAQTRNGTISGVILDSQTGRPVNGARVTVTDVTSAPVSADINGEYRIPAPPGTYSVEVNAEGYYAVEITDVVVTAGGVAEASTVMSSLSAVTSIDVVESATAVGTTAEAMLLEQKLAPVISDSLSRQELSSGTASDAAGALEKVTGVSVVGDGFVFVRGLGERYSSAQLNGAQIATTEPEKRVVPLDLFPSSLIENIRISKTYSPDSPAEFGGGLVQMSTIDFPVKPIFTLSVKSGFNTLTTFDRFFTYPGGSHDFFGFDDGNRSLPAAIPTDQRVIQGKYTPAELQSFGRSFSNNWEPELIQSARLPLDWSAVGGGSIGRFGLIGAITVGNSPSFQSEEQRYLRQGAGAPIVFSEYEDFRTYTEHAKLGAVFNVSVRLTPNQQLVFRNTLTHDAEKSAREFSGYDGGIDAEVSAQRLRWVSRNSLTSGVEGNHSFPSLRNSLIHWQFTHSLSTRAEPDLREVIRTKLSNGQYIYSSVGSSGIRFFSDLEDRIYEPQLDYSIPFFRGAVSGLFKTGFRATVRKRDFEARRFRYIPQRTTTLDLYLPSNELFSSDNIRPDGFQIVEFTRGTDAYAADMNIYAGYGMLDLAWGARWRFTGGIRIEGANQEVATLDNLAANAVPVIAALSNTDPAPVVNVIYSLSQSQNVRVSYSRTLSRPDFRELSPFDFNDVLGGYVVQGNPDLKRATINNYDFRWEHFSTGNQVLAASFFAKTFTNPIEATILPSNDLRETFVNAQGARNMGFELEFRRGLGSLQPRLSDFSVSSNFTFVDSNVDIKPEDTLILTNSSHSLVGQSRYIGNVITEWNKPRWRSTARFFFNYVSRRLADVGAFGVPDVFQEGSTTLDFSYQVSLAESGKWTVKFEAENLSDAPHRWMQGGFVQREYRSGRNFQIGTTYSFF